jgi:hypothetical protein
MESYSHWAAVLDSRWLTLQSLHGRGSRSALKARHRTPFVGGVLVHLLDLLDDAAGQIGAQLAQMENGLIAHFPRLVQDQVE